MCKKRLLIPAAGVGERMKIGYPKQYLPLFQNQTMLEVTVNRLAEMDFFDSIAVIVSANDSYIERCQFHGPVTIFRCGGKTRAETVLNGLCSLNPDENDWIYVHDAARPCVDHLSIKRLDQAIESRELDGAILAIAVTDTLKWVDDNGLIEKTIDRSHCYRAQTPQVFRAKPLIKALKNNTESVTDEAGAMEKAGAKVGVVTGSSFNIKVTYPEDLEAVQNFLIREKKDEFSNRTRL